MTPPLPLGEAQARLLGTVEPLAAETVAAHGAIGRHLAEPLRAARTQPAADLSAMDGYAVCGDDLEGPWAVDGESAAGHPFAGTLAPGQAIRISTGALMPAGGGAVLLQENAVREGNFLKLNGEGVPSERHIRRAGFDFRAGDALLDAGTRIGPAQLALAMAAGHGALAVHCLPTLAVLDSGDELAADPANCPPGKLPASNGAMLTAMSAPYAASIRRLGPVPDTMEAMLAALESAGDVDVIVTSGGASVGDHDLVRPALEHWGADIDFWRVAIKPGKPLLLARKEAQWVLGLPGNPVSSYVTAFLFLLPLLRRLGGAAEPLPRPLQLPLGMALPAAGDRTEFLRARIVAEALVAVDEQDSSALRALSAAEMLIVRPAGAGPASPGDGALAYRLENGGIA
ncbi:molybdopterin molybdotransferase MoeA [Croceibacterium aestuarii]|uniref:molybdopterin molybdotransferase MoeA n=1 Tax=Croceibacterium aestuarii TaxID=3064139 RepID=UPI00272DDEC6|nr:molybdopterin molybdotransferase MoeA [Croceibacterium sp. D39]